MTSFYCIKFLFKAAERADYVNWKGPSSGLGAQSAESSALAGVGEI